MPQCNVPHTNKHAKEKKLTTKRRGLDPLNPEHRCLFEEVDTMLKWCRDVFDANGMPKGSLNDQPLQRDATQTFLEPDEMDETDRETDLVKDEMDTLEGSATRHGNVAAVRDDNVRDNDAGRDDMPSRVCFWVFPSVLGLGRVGGKG